MRHTLASIVLFGMAVAAVYACGGTDGSPFTGVPADDAGGDGAVPVVGASDAGGGADARTNGDAGGIVGDDAGARDARGVTDAPLPDGGTPPTPGVIPCGAASCTAPQFCCNQNGVLSCQASGG